MSDENQNGDSNKGGTTDTKSTNGVAGEKALTRVRREILPVPWDAKVDKVQVGELFYRVEDEEEARLQYEERRKAERIRAEREAWLKGEGGRLCLDLYAKFQEYKQWLERLPRWNRDDQFNDCKQPEHALVREALFEARAYEEQRAERNRKNLEKARQAARCQHVYLDGEQCGAPRLKQGTLCRMHQGIEDAKAIKLDLGPLEDPDSIQAAIRKMLAAIADGTLDRSQVAQMTNLIQVAAWNVMRTSTAARQANAG